MYKRIISLAPSNTEILYALSADDFLMACTRYCDFPEGAKRKPRIGGWLDINDELVNKFEPDLLLTSTFVQNKITEKYKKSKMNVIALMPTTLKGVLDSIEKIGNIVNKKKESLQLTASMKDKFSKIQDKIKHSKCKPRVYVEEWHKPPTVSGNWVPSLVKMAGGKYELIKAGTHSKEVTTEQIQKYDPEIIIISICGMADKVPKEWVTKRKGWENLSAVKPTRIEDSRGTKNAKRFLVNSKVYVFDDSWLNRPGPRLTVGLEKLAKAIHPECF